MSSGTRLIDRLKFVLGFPPAVPTSATPAYVRLDNYNHVTIVLAGVNGGSGVTPTAVSLQQATSVGGAGAKPLGFARCFATPDTAAGDASADTPVASNTFTATGAASKSWVYVIEVDATTLDVNNGYDCLQVALGNAAAQTVSATYLLSGARVGGNVATFPSAIL